MANTERSGRRGVARWPRLCGAALVLLGIAAGACERRELPMEGARQSAESVKERPPQAIGGGPRATDESHATVRNVVAIAAVPSAEALAYEGATADLPNVVVRSVASDRAFWAGPSDSQQVLVVGSAGSAATLKPGMLVSVKGIVRGVGDRDRAKADWNLDAVHGARLDAASIYVEAQHLDVVAGE